MSKKELPACPECDKMIEVNKESQAIGEFLEWLESKGCKICEWVDGITEADVIAAAFALDMEKLDELEGKPLRGYSPISKNTEKILAEYFKIDLNKVEAERRALLAALRENEDR